MRILMFLLLLGSPSAFAIEQVFVASHAMKIEKNRGGSIYNLEAYDREGYKRISLAKQVRYVGNGNGSQIYYSFGVKETMTEGWRFQEITLAEYKLLLNHLTTTSTPGFIRRFLKGCVATVDISNKRLYAGSVNTCITPAPQPAPRPEPVPSDDGQSEVAERVNYDDVIKTTGTTY